ncbi:hypothetical protein RCL1_005148 [Eukaryota sp. TZLM3-RCL]
MQKCQHYYRSTTLRYIQRQVNPNWFFWGKLDKITSKSPPTFLSITSWYMKCHLCSKPLTTNIVSITDSQGPFSLHFQCFDHLNHFQLHLCGEIVSVTQFRMMADIARTGKRPSFIGDPECSEDLPEQLKQIIRSWNL